MYGLIGRMIAVEGKRQELLEILAESSGEMAGCLSYIIALDREHPDALWITEVWDSEDSHRNSLSIPAVKDAISRARPLIAGFDSRVETTPVGGGGRKLA